MGLTSDHARCVAAGMPFMMVAFRPLEFIVTPETTYIIIADYDPLRRIFTDGRDWPKNLGNLEPTFQGYSIGRWIVEDGDGRHAVLEVETRGPFKGPRAFDASGAPLHQDAKTIVKERIYLEKGNENVLHDEITVFDHALTRPLTVNKRYIRELRPIVWVEAICPEGNPYVNLEGQIYMRGADGKLMPAKKGQKPPDLEHFDAKAAGEKSAGTALIQSFLYPADDQQQ